MWGDVGGTHHHGAVVVATTPFPLLAELRVMPLKLRLNLNGKGK